MTLSQLPTINALLNTTSAILLTAGFLAIKKKNIFVHRIFMTSAFFTSILFLISYGIYHVHVGSTPYQGVGWIRPVYFCLLISHIILAAAVPPLAIGTLMKAIKGRIDEHKKWARWTYPIWMYVSVTGVVIYVMLY